MKADFRFPALLPAILILFFSQTVRAGFDHSEALIRKIELRRGAWTSLNAAVELKLKTFSQSEASCRGSLFYNRLDEKIFLDCLGLSGKTVFIFKTDDRNFELYLPSRKALYKGSIFALEDSPEIESHLRPLDLYRALKPAVFTAADILSVKKNPGGILINIKSGENQRRKIEVTDAGEVTREAYETPEGKVSLVIERSAFEDLPGGHPKSVFPKQILIKSSKDANVWETRIEFKTLSFPAFLPEEFFRMDVPGDVFIEEIS